MALPQDYAQLRIPPGYTNVFQRDARHVDLNYYGIPKKININALGQNSYQHQKLDEKYVESDVACLTLANGIKAKIDRVFKEPIHEEEYERVTKSSNAKEMRARIQSYRVHIVNYTQYDEAQRAGIMDAFRDIHLPSEKNKKTDPENCHVRSPKRLNIFLSRLSAVPEETIMPNPTLQEKLSGISQLEKPYIPWVLRRDKTFEPHIIQINGHDHIDSENRTYIFANGYGMRVRKNFDYPLSPTEYESHKTKRRSTIEEDNLQGMLAIGRECLDAGSYMKDCEFFPVFLPGPEFWAACEQSSAIYPYVGAKAMSTIDSDAVQKVLETMKKHFGGLNQTSLLGKTTEIESVGLCMHDISRLPPHNCAMTPERFNTIKDMTKAVMDFKKAAGSQKPQIKPAPRLPEFQFYQ